LKDDKTITKFIKKQPLVSYCWRFGNSCCISGRSRTSRWTKMRCLTNFLTSMTTCSPQHRLAAIGN